MVVKDLTYYCAFAIAMYSHLLALYMFPVTAPCGICKHKVTTFSKRKLCCCYKYVNLKLCALCRLSMPYSKASAGLAGNTSEGEPRRMNAGYISPNYADRIRKGYNSGKGVKEAKRSFDEEEDDSSHMGGDIFDQHGSYLADVSINNVISGDNCIGMNEAGVLFLSKTRPNCELVYASFTNDMKAKPYGIFRGSFMIFVASCCNNDVNFYRSPSTRSFNSSSRNTFP
jgi:hypothetical protein